MIAIRNSDRLTGIRRALLTAIGLFAMVVAGCALASRYVPITNHLVLAIAAASPYLMFGGLVATGALVAARRWILAAISTGLAATAVAIHLPLHIVSAGTATEHAIAVRVFSANLREGHADPGYLVSSVREHADVLSFQELTPLEVDRLTEAGIDATFPYRWLDAREDSDGVGLWSRYPISAPNSIGGYIFALVTAQIQVGVGSPNSTIAAVHLVGPWPQEIDEWRREIERFAATLHDITGSAGGGCVMVAGDFNSTPDMRPFRRLLRDGFHDAAEQSGAGMVRTFPADSWLPPLLAIDHILTRNCAATSVRSVPIPGSDHRGIVATVMVRQGEA